MSHEMDVQNKLVKVVPLSNILSLIIKPQNMSCNWKITNRKGLIGILLIVNYFENIWSNNPSTLQLDVISYKYWLHESLTSEIAPRENQCWPRRSRDWYCFWGVTISPLVQSIVIESYLMLVKCVVYVTLG